VTAFPVPDLALPTVDTPVDPTPPLTPPVRRRRWLRAVVPFLVVALFWSWTFAAHWLNEPNLGNPGTLAPGGTGPDGSSALSDRLRQHGITITRVTSTAAAVDAARGTDATIFVPEPDYLNGTLVGRVVNLGGNHRIVMVRPGLAAQLASGAPMGGLGDRWATKAVAPRCPERFAADAAIAAVFHSSYAPYSSDGGPYITMNCYSGGLVGGRFNGLDVVFVGASDPFRNSHIDEYGNSALALGVLSGPDRLIWVDVHDQERATGQPPQLKLPRYHRGDQARGGTGFPTIDAFPAMFWAALSVLVLAVVLFAIARARRLGPPVAEPLPVTVPAAEAVSGRGRLYSRIGAHEATLNALRAAAIVRLARVVYPFGGAPPERDLQTGTGPAADELVARIAARTGNAAAVRQVLHGSAPEDDVGLAEAVERLDALVAAVLRQNPTPDRPHSEETP
jgi:hypothetical protein